MTNRTRVSIALSTVALSLCALPAAAQPARAYRITFTNLTTGQPFTPPVVALHKGQIDLFAVGRAASEGIKEIAENGNLAPMLADLDANQRVEDVVVAAGTPPPLLGGRSVTVEVETASGARFLSFVSMLVCTNDGFTGVNSVPLPRKVGEASLAYGRGYDAGTEINTEDFADIVPPCAPLTGVASTDPGTGESNPALAEGGVVRPHANIAGGADLDPAIHSWPEPVVYAVVERIR